MSQTPKRLDPAIKKYPLTTSSGISLSIFSAIEELYAPAQELSTYSLCPEGRIRTFEGVNQLIYSQLPLSTWVPLVNFGNHIRYLSYFRSSIVISFRFFVSFHLIKYCLRVGVIT